MSFGYSVSDAAFLVQLAWKTIQNARKACGEHDELTREISSLHLVLRLLQTEISKPESPINRPDDRCKEELQVIAGRCNKVLRRLDRVLEKYNTLSEKERSAKKIWQGIRFGNGELAEMRDLREKLTYYTSALALFVNMVSMGSIGRIERQMEDAGGDIREMRIAFNGITAHQLSACNREGSVLTTYADDDKAVWKEFRKELMGEGFSSSFIGKHKQLIKAYIRELGDWGLLDDENFYDTQDLSKVSCSNTDDHASHLTQLQHPPRATSMTLSKTALNISEADMLKASVKGALSKEKVDEEEAEEAKVEGNDDCRTFSTIGNKNKKSKKVLFPSNEAVFGDSDNPDPNSLHSSDISDNSDISDTCFDFDTITEDGFISRRSNSVA